MKKVKRKATVGDWMTTYGDMVTLLLCFFVLLYSISTVDQQKYQNLVESFNPDVVKENTSSSTNTSTQPPVTQSEAEKAFEQMYDNLVREFDSLGLDADVEIIKGDGYNFIAFRDKVFFDGDSYVLKDVGKVALDALVRAISPASNQINEIQVLGHTTQALPNQVNSTTSDRMLSTERAAQVTSYIQDKNFLDPARLISLGYGQFRPIAPFDTEANRTKNRRVEILITNDEAVKRSLTEYYQLVYGDEVAQMQYDADK